ncbi:hypothetical protein [Sorangium sp. So ce124]|uniref:hypothetical protein n=1 Tax=Sorangium sp. So ce124 TaxID=3133280 RepID=UPI003F617B64
MHKLVEALSRLEEKGSPFMRALREKGKMLGVLVCLDQSGGLVELKAFSGLVGGSDWEDWCPPLDKEFRCFVPTRGSKAFDWFKVHDNDIGVCAAPKLLQHAVERRLIPIGLAEMWFEKGSGRDGVFCDSCDTCKGNLGTQLCGVDTYVVERRNLFIEAQIQERKQELALLLRACEEKVKQEGKEMRKEREDNRRAMRSLADKQAEADAKRREKEKEQSIQDANEEKAKRMAAEYRERLSAAIEAEKKAGTLKGRSLQKREDALNGEVLEYQQRLERELNEEAKRGLPALGKGLPASARKKKTQARPRAEAEKSDLEIEEILRKKWVSCARDAREKIKGEIEEYFF